MKKQETTTINPTANTILNEIKTLEWWTIANQNLTVLKKLAAALKSGDLDKSAGVCGEFKGHYRHTAIDSMLRSWQERLWKALEGSRVAGKS